MVTLSRRSWGLCSGPGGCGSRIAQGAPCSSWRSGKGKCLFLFLRITCCGCLRRAGKRQALRGDAPLWRGGGEKDRGKFATLRSTALAAASRGTHTGTEPWPSPGLENLPEATPGPRPRSDLRLFGVEFSIGTEFVWTQLALPRGLGLAWGGPGAGPHPIDPSSSKGLGGEGYSQGYCQGSCDVIKRRPRNPTSGCSFAPLLFLPEAPLFNCPGLRGGWVTLHVKQVRDKFSAQCKGNSGSVCFDFNPFLKKLG